MKRQARAKWTRETVRASIEGWEERYGRPPTSGDWRNAGHDPPHPSYKTVRGLFASWAGALADAGFKPARRRPRRRSARKDMARRLRQIADELDGGPSAGGVRLSREQSNPDLDMATVIADLRRIAVINAERVGDEGAQGDAADLNAAADFLEGRG